MPSNKSFSANHKDSSVSKNNKNNSKKFEKDNTRKVFSAGKTFYEQDSKKEQSFKKDKNFKQDRNFGSSKDSVKFKKEHKDFDRSKESKKTVSRRKEIVSNKLPSRPGFTSFQLRLVQSILNTVLVEKRPLDKAYAIWFGKVKIPSVEQGFIIRHINAMFRRLSFYAFVSSLKRPSDFERNVNRLILSYCAVEGWPLPELNAEGFDRSGLSKRIIEAKEHPLLNEGCPFWLEELCSKELGEAWPAERKALGQSSTRYIRTNTLKITRDELANKLSTEGVVTRSVKGVSTALEVTSNAALFRTQAFKDGYFEQQDAGSQQIADFLQVSAGMRVIDACAGSGGKTLHLAALMEGKGTLIALDVEGWKLDDLKKRARRAGAFNITTRVIESTKTIKRLYNEADRVLIDAPCSGLGVLRRTADSKWSDVRPRLPELKKIQLDILERYSHMAKVGGKVVYSTCSILPSENQLQVKAFLAKYNHEFILEEEKVILPSSGFDGFYMARLRRIAKAEDFKDLVQDSAETVDNAKVVENTEAVENVQATENVAFETTEQATNQVEQDNVVETQAPAVESQENKAESAAQ